MDGKIFEDLVFWISKRLHSVEVLIDQKLTDIHTGKKRQRDVIIKFTNGAFYKYWQLLKLEIGQGQSVWITLNTYTVKRRQFAQIQQSQFRTKYILQLQQKKAKQLGVRLFSLEEALGYDWSLTILSLKIIEQVFHTENSEILFLDTFYQVLSSVGRDRTADTRIFSPFPPRRIPHHY